MQHTSSRAQVRKLVVAAMLTAILWLIATTPYFGFTLPFFGVGMTFVHIPMIIGLLTEGLWVGTFLSGAFGFSSLFNAISRPTSIYAPMFQNPLVSVLPRLLIGPALYGVSLIAQRLLHGRRRAQVAVVSVSGALLNTLFTLSAMTAMQLINPGITGASSGVTIAGIWALAANAPFECASALIVCTALMAALDKLYHK